MRIATWLPCMLSRVQPQVTILSYKYQHLVLDTSQYTEVTILLASSYLTMASRLFLISFISLILLHGCIAKRNELQEQQECNFDSMQALQPTSTIEAEGGRTEFWNPDTKQFRCAGVAFLRHTIRRKSLLVPSYANSVLMAFVEQGIFVIFVCEYDFLLYNESYSIR